MEQDGEDFYIVGADSVRKKLGSGTPERITIFSGNSASSHIVDVTQYNGWETFTVENFCLDNVSVTYSQGRDFSAKNKIINRYDATTGKLYLNSSGSSDGYGYCYFASYSIILLQ